MAKTIALLKKDGRISNNIIEPFESQNDVDNVFKTPIDFGVNESKLWSILVGVLKLANVLRESDYMSLYNLVTNQCMLIEATNNIRSYGTYCFINKYTGEFSKFAPTRNKKQWVYRINPSIDIVKKIQPLVTKSLNEFGLSPSSRANIIGSMTPIELSNNNMNAIDLDISKYDDYE